MKLTKYHTYYIISMILASFRPIFYKYYKEYFIMTIFLSLLSMYIGGTIYIYKTTNDLEETRKKVLKSLKRDNLFMSILSEIRFILKQFAVIVLPLSISIPMNNLWLGSSLFFGKMINNENPTIIQIISIGIIIFGCIILNLHKILYTSTKKLQKVSYFKGIVSLLLSTILGGYLYSLFKKISTESQDPGFTMNVESGGALIILSFILLYDRIFCKKINIPSFKNICIMFLILTLLFNIDIILMFTGLSHIKQIDTLYLSQIRAIIPIFIGLFLFKENINIYKMIGLFIIGAGVYLGLR